MTQRLPPLPFSLRQLQYVVAVAEELSFRRAAERCRIAQPSLSAQIAELEGALGLRLFERDRRRVIVTPAGREIVERARRLLAEADHLAEAARRANDPWSGTLRIGVIPTIAPYLLPGFTPLLKKKYPRLTVAWVEDKTGALVRALDEGTLDAALLALEAKTGDFESDVIASDPFVLAAPSDHPLARAGSSLALDKLRDADVLLLDEGHCLRDQALELCSAARAEELEFRATSLPTLVQMVAGGAGVTLLPSIAVPTETRRADIRVRPFAAPSPGRTLALLSRKQNPLQAPLKAVAELIREVARATLAKARPR